MFKNKIYSLFRRVLNRKGCGVYTTVDIANLIIFKYGEEQEYWLSRFRIPVLLYFIQAEYIKRYNEPLLKEKINKRWMGAYIASIYHTFKGFEFDGIKNPVDQYEIVDGRFVTRKFDEKIYSDRIILLVEYILRITKDVSCKRLVEFIRNEEFWEKDKDIFLDVRNNVYYTYDELKGSKDIRKITTK